MQLMYGERPKGKILTGRCRQSFRNPAEPYAFKQGNLNVNDFYTELKILWEELECYKTYSSLYKLHTLWL